MVDFHSAIIEAIRSEEAGANVISDGRFQCAYRELAEIFGHLDDFFNESPMGEAGAKLCTVFRCGNSLPEAVVLLWLLYRKKDFLLLPSMDKRKQQAKLEDIHLPEFCKYKMSIDTGSPDLALDAPVSYIRIEPNANFKEDNEAEVLTGSGGVYLRTSGSTAEPKLVMHTNEKLFGNTREAARRLELTHHDRIIIPVPLYHMYGLGAGFLPGALVGASIHLLANTNVIRYLDGEKQFNPNVSFMTPVLCEMLLHIRKGSYGYRLVVSAGDRIGKTTFENFEKRFGKLINLYGSTELGVIATNRLADPLEDRSNGVIEPLPGVKIRLEGEEGGMAEILCRHKFGLDAYVDRKGRRISGAEIRWFRTKDLGKWITMKEGTFKVMGRTGNSMNRSGILVAFSEVESIMEQGIEEILHVVAVGADEVSSRGKKLVACCEPKSNARGSGKEIRSRCFDIMLRHMVPDEVMVMNEIPRLPNGKFDRKTLADRILLK